MLWKSLLPAVAWAVFIGILSAVPGKSLPKTDFWELLSFDKFAHFTVYAILAYLVTVGLHKQHTHRKIRYYGKRFALLIVISYGVLIELMQHFVFSGRSFEWFDVLANTTGSLAGIWVFGLIYDKVLQEN